MNDYKRISGRKAALNIFEAMMEHGGMASTAEMIEWTGMSLGHINKGKRWLTHLDDDGVFICIPKGPQTTYKLSPDLEESRLYIIWLLRRSFRFQQSALRATVKSERVANRVGVAGATNLYAQKASQVEALAGQKATLRQFGAEAGFSVEDIESWFADDKGWTVEMEDVSL